MTNMWTVNFLSGALVKIIMQRFKQSFTCFGSKLSRSCIKIGQNLSILIFGHVRPSIPFRPGRVKIWEGALNLVFYKGQVLHKNLLSTTGSFIPFQAFIRYPCQQGYKKHCKSPIHLSVCQGRTLVLSSSSLTIKGVFVCVCVCVCV